MSTAGGIVIAIFVLLIAAAVGWVVFTQLRARRLGVCLIVLFCDHHSISPFLSARRLYLQLCAPRRDVVAGHRKAFTQFIMLTSSSSSLPRASSHTYHGIKRKVRTGRRGLRPAASSAGSTTRSASSRTATTGPPPAPTSRTSAAVRPADVVGSDPSIPTRPGIRASAMKRMRTDTTRRILAVGTGIPGTAEAVVEATT